MKKLRNIVFLALLGLTLLLSKATPTAAKVNEYEGQHRVAFAGDPSQWG
jgi:hypothetical protein